MYSFFFTQTFVNVVTTSPRPGGPAPPRHIYTGTPAPTYYKATFINMVICSVCSGLVGTILLIPALMCAAAVSAFVV